MQFLNVCPCSSPRAGLALRVRLWETSWVRSATTLSLHSGCKNKMAALQFLLRARNFDTLLHRSSFVVNKIACSIRYISEGKIYDFKLQQNLLGKVGVLYN